MKTFKNEKSQKSISSWSQHHSQPMLLQAAGTLTQPGMAEHPPPLWSECPPEHSHKWVLDTQHKASRRGFCSGVLRLNCTSAAHQLANYRAGKYPPLQLYWKKKIKNSSLGLEGHPRKSDMSPQILMPTHTTSQAAAEPISVKTHHQHGAQASARELTLESSLVSYLQLQFSLTPTGKNCVQLLLKPNICMYAFLNKLSTCKYLA